MPANTQFSIAVHLMAGLGLYPDGEFTSTNLASSVNTSASFVRRTLAKLSHAGLVITTKGKHGSCRLSKHADQISLLDVHRAVGSPAVFAIHEYEPNAPCRVSCRIKYALSNVLEKSQSAFEQSLSQIKLSEVISDIENH